MYIDILIRIQNASERGHEKLKVPHSKLDLAVLESLVKNKYIESATKKGRGVKRIIEITLKYEDNKPAITGIKLVSKPSRRMYIGYRDIKKSHQGYGHYILSTSQGILSGYNAGHSCQIKYILLKVFLPNDSTLPHSVNPFARAPSASALTRP